MKLLSSLNSGSVPGSATGELRMFFTSSFPNAVNGDGFWQKTPGDGSDLLMPYTLSNNDQVILGLSTQMTPNPGQIYLEGSIQVVTASGNGGANSLLGGWTLPPSFVVGTPGKYNQWATSIANNNGVTFVTGFNLNFTWDGTYGVCTGPWWAIWK